MHRNQIGLLQLLVGTVKHPCQLGLNRSNFILASKRADKLEYGTARSGIFNPKKRPIEFDTLSRVQELDQIIIADRLGKARSPVAFVTYQLFEEVLHADAKYTGQFEQTTGPVLAFLLGPLSVIIDRQPESFTKFFLTHTQQHTPQSNTPSDVNIHRVGLTGIARIRNLRVNAGHLLLFPIIKSTAVSQKAIYQAMLIFAALKFAPVNGST